MNLNQLFSALNAHKDKFTSPWYALPVQVLTEAGNVLDIKEVNYDGENRTIYLKAIISDES